MTTLSKYRTAVIEDWIDYNGHMSEAFYVLVFGFATDAALETLGLAEDYRSETGCSLYTVEAHVRYLKEAGLGAALEVTTEVVGVQDKKLHLVHTMSHAGDVIATEEILGIHVDQQAGGASVLPDLTLEAAREALAAPPPWAGRHVSV